MVSVYTVKSSVNSDNNDENEETHFVDFSLVIQIANETLYSKIKKANKQTNNLKQYHSK